MNQNIKPNIDPSHRFSVAPMMEWTDKHCRVFHRILTKKSMLYTEMVVAQSILHGDLKRILAYNEAEHPVCLQIGGSEPELLVKAAKIVEEFGYDEINLNVGCPSKRVRSGSFGACLMYEPELVGDCLQAMREAVKIPVHIKHRIGVDGHDPEEILFPFVEYLASRGTDLFVVHARKAILKGLTPKENRDIPPLNYDIVRRLKDAFPHLGIVLNGGLNTIEQSKKEMGNLDGVMLGRAAYKYPHLLGEVDKVFFGEDYIVTPMEAYQKYRPYIEEQLSKKVPLHAMTKHLLGLFNGYRGARTFRRVLGEEALRKGSGLDIYDKAIEAIDMSVSEPA
ncbi:MAG: tRNA dihydrouridine(20/20a) synthase DusA [Caulobacterales bacterium]|nr:tRNA dihydrouridine(20/20a) synthase DusA [Caulobacterales bacterium]MCA0372766.1 tRNA dihydrouridine(20/20a) synthase DusA [Pseudomonadota bacterium]